MAMNLVEFIVLALATYRMALLVTQEEGPFKVFLRIRSFVGIVPDDDGKPWVIPDQFFPKLLSCVWCSSVWIGSGITVAYFLFPIITPWLCLPLALSAVAVRLDS